jgi:hypothetical protein
MSTASTGQSPRKRVRIDMNNNQEFDCTFLAGSVATLLPVMKDLVTTYYDRFIKLSKRIYDKEKATNKFTNPDFIPKSAKSKFELGASDDVRKSNLYSDIARAADDDKKDYELKQKSHILQAAKLEIGVARKKLDNLFIEGIYVISRMMLLYHTDCDETNELEVHHIIKELFNRDPTLLKHVFESNSALFINQYVVLYPLAANVFRSNDDMSDDGSAIVFPTEATIQQTLDAYLTQNSVASTSTEPLQTQTSIQQRTATTASSTQALTNDDTDEPADDDVQEEYEQLPTTHPLREHDLYALHRLIKDVFVNGWTQELNNIKHKALSVKMAKFSKLALVTKATDEAAAIVANEPAAEMHQLNDIINKKVAEQTKKIKDDFNKAIQRLQRNNNGIGNDGYKNNNKKNSLRGEHFTRPARKNSSQKQHRKGPIQQITTNRRTTPQRRFTPTTPSPRKAQGSNSSRNTERTQRPNRPNRQNTSTRRNNQNTPTRRNNRNTPTPTRKSTNSRQRRSPSRDPMATTPRYRTRKADDARRDTSGNNNVLKRNNGNRISNTRRNSNSTKRGRRNDRQP